MGADVAWLVILVMGAMFEQYLHGESNSGCGLEKPESWSTRRCRYAGASRSALTMNPPSPGGLTGQTVAFPRGSTTGEN